jgi:DNA-binding response OmpR family regulator
MENVALNREKRVLIVDRCPELREVLRTLLERRGVTTIEARRADHAIELATRVRPNVIVLDADSDQSESQNATHELRVAASRNDTPIVILGKLSGQRGGCPSAQFLPKPYHYGQLVRKIEGLLATA